MMDPQAATGMSDLIRGWDGRAVVTRWDAATEAWMFVALHDDTLGTPVGGCRMMVYPRPEDGLRDAMRLAEGMTFKWAALDLPFGGGKSVLALTRPLEADERRGLFERFGELLNTLAGAYGTGEDLGTTPDDMRFLASVTPHVVGIPKDGSDGPVDPGPFTALGVFSGIRAALGHAFSDPSLEGRTVLVQGVGDVGAPLAALLVDAGADVVLTDVDEERAASLADEIGARTVNPAQALGTPCDVLAPCAVGAIINPTTIPRLRCRIVAGSANNQLASPADADALRDRGILYAPDYVVNGGGALAFGLLARGWSEGPQLRERVERIGDALTDIFREASRDGITPLEAAGRRVRRTLASGGGDPSIRAV